MEIDAIILGYLLQNDLILPTPLSVNYTGFTSQAVAMCRNGAGTNYGVPSYSCTNVYFSHNTAFGSASDVEDVKDIIDAALSGHPERIGWSGDLLHTTSLRLAYIDSHLDRYPNVPLHPSAYNSHLKPPVVQDLQDLRDTCVDTLTTPHSNPCVEGTYYSSFTRWFGDFNTFRSVVLYGFPEYFAEIKARAPMNAEPGIYPALMGDGNKPYTFTDAFVLSKENCGADCTEAAIAWLNWQKVNHLTITSLGLDVTPPTPRYLAVSNADLYGTSGFQAHAAYATFYGFQQNAVPLNTLMYLQNDDSQYAALSAEILDNYVAP